MTDTEWAAALAAYRSTAPLLTAAAHALADNYLAKGGFLIALLAWTSTKNWPRIMTAANMHLPRSIAAISAAILIGRLLQILLPHRDRPFVALLHDPAASGFAQDNSFPSDHAVFMTAIALAVFFRNRRLGVFALGWTAFAVLLPRIYLGYHYPTDIIAGVVIGGAICWFFMRVKSPEFITRSIHRIEARNPVLAYAAGLVFAYCASTNFEDLRILASTALKAIGVKT